MTISNQSNTTTALGNGVQKVFDYGFLIPTPGAAELYFADSVTGQKTLLSPSSWQLTGVGNPTGGTFIYPLAASAPPITSTQSLILVRKVPYTQLASFQNQTGFYPKTLESALDTIVMQVQQVAGQINEKVSAFDASLLRAIRAPVFEAGFSALPPSNSRQNSLVGFDAAGGLALLPLQPGNNTTIIAQNSTTARALSERFGDQKNLKDFGAAGDGVTDDTAAINSWLDAISLYGRDGYAPPGLYLHSAPLTFNPRTSGDKAPPKIILSPQTIFRATAPMGAQLTLGTINPDYSGLLRGGLLQGGIFDCNNLAQTGIHAVFLNWFTHRDAQVWNYLGPAFKAGSFAAPASSYEAFYDNVRAWSPPRAYKTITGITQANPAVVTSPGHGFLNGQKIAIQGVAGMTQLNFRYFDVSNVTANTFQINENTSSYGAYTSGGSAHACRPDTTRGIFFENCTDNHISTALLQGCFRGVDGDMGGGVKPYDGKYVNVHCWNFFENGEIDSAFYLGGDNALINCQVDGPFLYGYRFSDLRNSVTNSNVNMPNNYGGIDNRSSPVRLESGAGAWVVNCNWKAQDAACRLAADVTGDLSNYRATGVKSRNVIMTRSGVDDNAVSTWALCGPGGTSVAVLRGLNVNSVTRDSVGRYTITTAFALPVNGPCHVTAVDTESINAVEENGTRTPFTLTVLFYSAAGSLIDPANFSVSVGGA